VPHVNPLIDVSPAAAPPGDPGPPAGVLNQAPAPAQGPVDAVNPYEGTVNDTNAAGTQEAVAAHVAVLIVLALVGVYVLRGTGFKFVVAAGVGG
jgi:hypothetical protein